MPAEQILLTLATQGDLAAAIAPLATREEMHRAIKGEGERTRQHFDAVAGRLESQIQLLAEGYGSLREDLTSFRAEVKAQFAVVDRRPTRLEASR
jgi:hypothetical protein